MIVLGFYLLLILFLAFLPLALIVSWRDKLAVFFKPKQPDLALLHLSFQIERQGLNSLGKLPRYKDFTTQLELLLDFHRRLGIPLKQALSQWKRALIDERKKERHLKRQKGQAQAQALLMLAMTWTFIALSSIILKLVPSIQVIAFCALTPVIGSLFYFFSMKIWERRLFRALRLFERSLQRLTLLQQTGLSSEQLLKHLSLELIDGEKSKVVQNLKAQYLSLLGAWRERGIPLKTECELMLEEISFLLQEACDRLFNFEKGLKIFVMMIFFLVPYLVYLLSLISSFLIE